MLIFGGPFPNSTELNFQVEIFGFNYLGGVCVTASPNEMQDQWPLPLKWRNEFTVYGGTGNTSVAVYEFAD